MDAINNSAFASTSDPKTAIMNSVRQEAAVANARQLIDKINEHCFDKCVPTPGSSFSSKEQSCFSQCMTKYIDAWNTVGRTYAQRAQREAATMR